jgi:hypothetical protein
MDKIRKEVSFASKLTIDPLQKEADRRGWPLKKYMEYVIIKESSRLFAKQSKKK